jgi:hypothetical protein
MSEKNQDYCNTKIFLFAISATVLVGSFVVGSQFVQQSFAQNLSQLGQQAKEKIGGAAGQLGGGNQSGNQNGNQSSGFLGQLGQQAKNYPPGQ